MPVDVASLKVLRYPAASLRAPARPIAAINREVCEVACRMIELMHEAEGLGLAAPQVGLSWRLFVANSKADGEPDRIYVNPVLSGFTDIVVPREEGCLSLPGITAEILRPEGATITAIDLDGRAFTLTDQTLLARVWQHEMDHLNGVLIIDRMSPMDRLVHRRAVKDLEATAHG